MKPFAIGTIWKDSNVQIKNKTKERERPQIT